MPVPGCRIGNSSSTAFADPGLRIGNSSSSSSSRTLGIGIGAEMVPRIDLRPGLARPEGDFHRLGMVIRSFSALQDGYRREGRRWGESE